MNRDYTTRLKARTARAVLLALVAATLAGCATPPQGSNIPAQLEAERAQLFKQGFTQYAN